MRLLELDSYNMENDRTFLKSIEEHVKDPYIRERLINRLEWYMVMANRCQCFYYMSACMGIVMPTLILLLNSIPERLKSETSFYMLGVGNYRDRKQRDQMFLNALEDLSLKENQMWKKEESSHSSYRQEQGGRRRPNG